MKSAIRSFMKSLISLLALISCAFAADEYRMWTQAATGRKIEAKLLDKSPDDVKVQLCTRDGKAYWMPISSLVEDDLKIIQAWKKKPLAFHPLQVRIVGKPGDGKKTIETVVKCWEKGATLTVYFSDRASKIVKTLDVEPYGTDSWTGDVSNNYKVTLIDTDGVVVSEQTALKKD